MASYTRNYFLCVLAVATPLVAIRFDAVDHEQAAVSETQASNAEAAVLDWDVDIKEMVDRVLESKESMASSELEGAETNGYSYVQQVGLSLYTFPSNFATSGVEAFYDGIDKAVSTYAGLEVNNLHDAKERVKVLKYFVELAYKSEHWSRDPRVLKVFMAPEFFFRGPHGAYNIHSMHGCTNRNKTGGICNAPIMAILLECNKFIQDARFSDWLFVFGTVVAYKPAASRGALMIPREYFNFAPIMRGGPAGRGQHHIVAKSYMSGIDFLDCDGSKGKLCVANPKSMGIGKYAIFSQAQQLQLTKLGFQLRPNNDFHQDGIHFGLEVCLDHAQHRLEDGLRGGTVQVHLVTSAGMSIEWSATRDGPVMLQDGGGAGARTSYYCPGCDYLGKGRSEVNGLTPSHVVFSSTDDAYDTIAHRVKFSRSREAVMSTPRDQDEFFSKAGYASEGSGFGYDLRFDMSILRDLYATDDYKPQINISPAFKLNAGGYGKVVAPHGNSILPKLGACFDVPTTDFLINGRPATCPMLSHHCRSKGRVAEEIRLACRLSCGLCK